MISRTFSGTSISSIVMSVRKLTGRIKYFPILRQMPVQLFDEEWISLARIKEEAGQTFRDLAPAQFIQHLRDGVPRQAVHLQRTVAMPNQLFQRSSQRGIVLRISVAIGANDYDRELTDAIGEMNQKSQGRFVRPVKVLEDINVRTCSRRVRQPFRNALEQIAAFMRRRQFHWRLNIRKNSPNAGSHLRKFGLRCRPSAGGNHPELDACANRSQ